MGDMTLPDLEGHRAATESFVPMDEEAFRAFYERTSRPVWAYLSRITGDRQLADDLLQEAYYRFYRAGAAHVDEAHRRNSLFRIATNLAHDHRRMLQHRVDRNAAELDDESFVSAGNAAARADERTDLGRAMARLQPRQREALWLAYAQGSSHDEIADVIGVSRSNVKSLLHRARRKLAELLRGEGGANRV